MVKRYAITMEESFRKSKPKVHVSPSRQRRANAPNTHDLRKNVDNNNLISNSTTAADVIFVQFDVSLLPDSSLSIKIKLKNRSIKAKPPF